MAEPLPPAKKLKTENAHTDEYEFFWNFLEDKNNIAVLGKLRVMIEFMGGPMVFLKIKSANATFPVSFTKASIDTDIYLDQNNQRMEVPILIFFRRGLRVIQNFVDKDDPQIPKDAILCWALKELLQFLKKDHSALHEKKPYSEPQLALRYAQYLMISLVPQKPFVLDKHYQNMRICCSLEHGEIGDTSFGVAEGWHGRTDIMINGEELHFMVKDAAEGSDDVSAEGSDDVNAECSDTDSQQSHSSVEMKKSNCFTKDDFSQIYAQTVVLSFLQNKINALGSNSSLVPGIAISAEKLMISMYDCKEDTLMKSKQLDLFSLDGDLNFQTIVYLWLALNHKLFCTGIPDQLKMCKANFHDRLGPKYLQIYTQNVTRPLPIQSDTVPEFPDESNINPVVLEILSEIKKKEKYEDRLDSVSLKKEMKNGENT